jgi:Ca-activated chloride channel family protein
MVDDRDLERLGAMRAPEPDRAARARALAAAFAAYDEKSSPAAQGSAGPVRLTSRAIEFWRGMMQKKMYATTALATLVALPIAGYATLHLMRSESPFVAPQPKPVANTEAPAQQSVRQTVQSEPESAEVSRDALSGLPEAPPPAPAPMAGGGTTRAVVPAMRSRIAPTGEASKMMAEPSIAVAPPPADMPTMQQEDRDRLEATDTNPVRSALETPVSTFSIDVDTASYSFVRRSLKEGFLPQADTVRVEEIVNYFPYDWPRPESRENPFATTVAVMPTPWNAETRLMHVAIKGYETLQAERPRANLVFLIDVSGSMDAADKLPLLKSAFRLLVGTLSAEDTVSIVTYAGDAGTVLEPTKASEREKILSAIDNLRPGGSTAGEAGIREAYRLAQESFVQGGVNRVMLATDGDFNVGQSSDEDLERLIEEKRRSGVFLSVFGFGRGNLNDQMMQTIAQNGNGTAAYIDTLAEAQKVLVDEASSTLFPIAKDVKIQVEFNPAAVAEYRLIGYETRALKREDFNNDRVDAGEIGSGHSVTAIYEITPKGSPAAVIDDLRYGEAATQNPGGIANADEYAFVKIRYKAPDGDVSKLIETPVTRANEVDSFDAASVDQRFSVAAAAFGQKLRDTDQTAGFSWDRIIEIATAARGADPYGYRSEFLSLVRLASALEAGRR